LCTLKLPSSSNFELCLHSSDIQANFAKLAEVPNLSNILSEYYKFANVFSKTKAEVLTYHPYDLQINLEEDNQAMAANDFIHPSQLGSLKFKSTIDVGIALTYIIQTGWIKNLSTSTLAFDIAQFFPSLNYCLLTLIMKKVGFNNCIVSFFANYLVDRKTNYFWNNFMSPIININIGVGQSSMLLPILSALYLLPFIYILLVLYTLFWHLNKRL